MGIFTKIYWLSSDKSNGHFTLIPTVVYNSTPLNYYSVKKIVEKVETNFVSNFTQKIVTFQANYKK
jgi:hypothetical protein